MKTGSLCALVLALALPAVAQTEPQLEPLIPQSAPSPQKDQKKPARKKRAPKKPPPGDARVAAPQEGEAGQLALPPLAPLAPSAARARRTRSVGVLVLGALRDGAAELVSDGLRAVLKLAPSVRDAIALEAPRPCTNEACWLVAGEAANVDQVLVTTLLGGTLRIKLVDVVTHRHLAQAQQERVSSDPAEATAWSEALACKLFVPGGCTGEAVVDAPEGVELELDGQPLQRGEKRILPVGVHALRIKEGEKISSRPLAVLHESAAALSIAPPPAAPPAPVPVVSAPTEPAPAAAVTTLPSPAPRRTWTRTAGYATAGAAVVAAAAGVYFGAKSRSDLNRAEASYRANGAYQPSDLDALRSGNSAAHTANALLIASGVLLAAGAALTFAF
jgi:hypothetical protein